MLSIDIESGGCQPNKHPLIAIGTCFLKNGIKEKRIFRLEYDLSQFEEKCLREFWSKNMDKLEKLNKLPKSTIQDFANYVDQLDKESPNLVIVSDNPAYDIGFINYHYDLHLNRRPLQYKFDGRYRIIVDQNSYLWALCPEVSDPWINDTDIIKKFQLKLQSTHDHMPDNDAEWILDILVESIKANKN